MIPPRRRPAGAASSCRVALSACSPGSSRSVARVASFDGRPARRRERRRARRSATPCRVDGVCLTVVEARDGRLAFDVVQETLDRTKPFGDEVNVEAALRAGEPLGGHYVQGHVDGVGTVRSVGRRRSGSTRRPELLRYVVEKGSITVDGVSLTVAALDDARLRRRARPAHARGDDARRPGRRRPRQPRGRRPREVRRAATTDQSGEGRGKERLRHDRGGDRGHPPGQVRRRRRRGRPRERGRPRRSPRSSRRRRRSTS